MALWSLQVLEKKATLSHSTEDKAHLKFSEASDKKLSSASAERGAGLGGGGIRRAETESSSAT